MLKWTILFCAVLVVLSKPDHDFLQEKNSSLHELKSVSGIRAKRQNSDSTIADRGSSEIDLNMNHENQNEQPLINEQEQTDVPYNYYDRSPQHYRPPPPRPPPPYWGGYYNHYYRPPPPPDGRYPRRPGEFGPPRNPWNRHPPPPPYRNERSWPPPHEHGPPPPPHGHGPPHYDHGHPPPHYDHGPPYHRPPPPPPYGHGPPHYDHKSPPPPPYSHRPPHDHGPPPSPPYGHGPLRHDQGPLPPPPYDHKRPQQLQDLSPQSQRDNGRQPPEALESQVSQDQGQEDGSQSQKLNVQQTQSNDSRLSSDENDEFIKNLKLVFNDDFKNTILKTRQTVQNDSSDNSPSNDNTREPQYKTGQGKPLISEDANLSGPVDSTPSPHSYIFQVVPVTPES